MKVGGHLVLALAMLAACGSDKGSRGADLADDARAGEVTAVTGEVSASLAGEARALAVGGVVYAGDEVVTAAGAEVSIRLDHNAAELTLGGGKTVVLRKHAAWRASKPSVAALEGAANDKTAAAGRQSERQAGDTAATAPKRGVLGGVEATETIEEADDRVVNRRETERARATATEQARREAELKAKQAELEAKLEAERRRLVELKSQQERRKLRDSRRPKGGGKKTTSECDPGDPLCGLDGESTSDGASGPLPAAEVDAGLRRISSKLAACKKHGTAAVKVEMKIGPSGKPARVAHISGGSKELSACVLAAVRQAWFAKSGSGGTFRRTLQVK